MFDITFWWMSCQKIHIRTNTLKRMVKMSSVLLCASSGNSFWTENQKSPVEECVIMLQFMITSPIKASSSCIDSASLYAGLNLNGLWIHSSWIASLDKLCVNCWHRPRPRCSATKDWIGTTVGPTSCMKSASVGNMSKHPFSTRVAFPFNVNPKLK